MKAPKSMTRGQLLAWANIDKIVKRMNKALNVQELDDLYAKADDLRWKYFPAQAAAEGDNWGVTRLYVQIEKELTAEKYVFVTLFGKNVRMATA